MEPSASFAMTAPTGDDHSLDAALLAEQSEYYRQRAPEYDDWWFRRGGYDQGEVANRRWFAQASQLERALADFAPSGRVLELACGTGLWTRHLVRYAERLTALDGSEEMIALNRERVGAASVDYFQTDLFQWQPSEQYDVCFFGFWLSHVPRELFAEFWEKISRSLLPGGRVFFLDSAPLDRGPKGATEPQGRDTMSRRLADGRKYTIVKRFYEPAELQRELVSLGFQANVQKTADYFIHATARPSRPSV
jgi:SAM-dependent methyltransferase